MKPGFPFTLQMYSPDSFCSLSFASWTFVLISSLKSFMGRKETSRRLIILTARRVPELCSFFLHVGFPTCSNWNYVWFPTCKHFLVETIFDGWVISFLSHIVVTITISRFIYCVSYELISIRCSKCWRSPITVQITQLSNDANHCFIKLKSEVVYLK